MEKPIVFVGLDYDNQQDNIKFAEELAKKVSSNRYGFKVNLDSVANFSPSATSSYSFVKEVMSHGKPVFVDMKMWNGERTMRNVAKGCAELGVNIINMYPHAGKKSMTEVLEAINGSNTRLFGLTVLTHYTERDMKIYGRSFSESVKMFAQMSYDYGAHGIILPGTELKTVKDIPSLKLCPGIRPNWYNLKDNDQEQVVTPSEAIDNGANYIVVSSAIRKSRDGPEALERILLEIK